MLNKKPCEVAGCKGFNETALGTCVPHAKEIGKVGLWKDMLQHEAEYRAWLNGQKPKRTLKRWPFHEYGEPPTVSWWIKRGYAQD